MRRRAASPSRLGGYALVLAVLGVLGKLGVLAVLVAECNGAQTGDDGDGEARLRQAGERLLPHFADDPKAFRERFAPIFFREVKDTDLEKALKDIFKNHGAGKQVRVVRLAAAYEGEVEFVFEKNARIPTTLRLESKPPYRISGLQFHGAYKENETLGELMAEIRALPGKSAFSFAKLGPPTSTLWEHNSSESLAVGSCFKLLLLATLADEIEQGKRTWQDTVKLQRELISLPSGLMQDWPIGSPVTLHTLATLMISRSDNTAADHLFRALGRPTIEAMQTKAGVRSPERNQPFLSAGEFFRIKYVLGSEQQKQYADADVAQRRKLLDTLVKNTPLVQPRSPNVPVLIEQVEWLFSSNDMVRTMDWLRRRDKAGQVRDILAIGRGMSVDRTYWQYVGYKIGYEPGVACIALLLQDASGQWFALAMIWNDPQKDVDYTRLLMLAQRVLRLAQRQQVK